MLACLVVPVFVAMLVDKPWSIWKNMESHGVNKPWNIQKNHLQTDLLLEDFPNITADVCWFTNHCICLSTYNNTPTNPVKEKQRLAH